MPQLRIGYKTIHYADWIPSPSEKEPRATIVFTHGLGSSQNFYVPIVPGLLEQDYRCIAFDTTGAARSSYTQVEQSVKSLGSDVVAVMDALGVEKAVVVGHSMGGLVAATLATISPERLSALVLLAPVDPSEAVSEAFEKRIALVEEKGMEPLANSIPTGATAKSASLLSRAFIRELLLAQTGAGYISNCRVIASAEKPDYSKIKGPVLLVVGDEDGVVPVKKGKEVFEKLGAEVKKFVELRQCGHWPVIEQPEQVQTALLQFLTEYS